MKIYYHKLIFDIFVTNIMYLLFMFSFFVSRLIMLFIGSSKKNILTIIIMNLLYIEFFGHIKDKRDIIHHIIVKISFLANKSSSITYNFKNSYILIYPSYRAAKVWYKSLKV